MRAGAGLGDDSPAASTLATMADQDDRERVRQATNIVELVEAVTKVTKKGRTFKAICPFHQEKTPSLSLEPAKGLYHCFGCQKGGDVFDFVMETQALSFPEALEWLAQRANITLTRDPRQAKSRGERQRLIEAVEAAADFYHDRLRTSSDAGGARAYLRGRGFDADAVSHFKLGYAPEGWDTLISHLKAKNIREQAIIDAGLGRRSSRGRLHDWFRHRILFPIFDERGDAVGFGGRILEAGEPKYLNTPETRLYHKARLLYGLNWAKAPITRQGYAVIVEGYTDVMALHRAGYPVAVATCGTALGDDHFDLLRRFADTIVMAFDADAAGAAAALRAGSLEVPTDLSLDLRVALMPSGKDPADLVQDGEMELLAKAVDESVPFVQFRVDAELARHNLAEAEGRTRAVHAVAPIIAQVRDPIARNEYTRTVARRTGVDIDLVESTLRAQPVAGAPAAGIPAVAALTGQDKAERQLLRALAEGVISSQEIDEGWFASETHRRMAPLMTGDIATGDATLDRYLREIVMESTPLPPIRDLTARLEGWRVERRIKELEGILEHLEPGTQEYSGTLAELVRLNQQRATKPRPQEEAQS